jgi:hypothetical protein
MMGNLASLAAIAQLGSAAATAGNAYGQYSSNLGQAKFATSALNQNATIADMQAAQAQKNAEQAAAYRGLQASQQIGKERVGTGAAKSNTGSAAKVQSDIASAAIQDEAQIMNNAALQKWGYGIEAAQYRTQGQLAKIAGRYKANSSLISGGMKFAGDLGQAGLYANKGGVFDGDPFANNHY